MTPGVYIEEKNAFPSSAVAVGTAIPVFIGYTEKATRAGKSLLHQATKIASFAEYVEIFGAGFKSKFTVVPAAAGDDCFNLNGVDMAVKINDNNTYDYINVSSNISNNKYIAIQTLHVQHQLMNT